MAVITKTLGEVSEDPKVAIKQLVDYINYLTEIIDFNDSNLKKRINALEA
ncbi:MAG: hypothetical protein VB078_06890 [Clostridiaceae bacterium]|nr:hypothetical protein [Clostridiaceae bacterium]